jgi:hypothetical protein
LSAREIFQNGADIQDGVLKILILYNSAGLFKLEAKLNPAMKACTINTE